MLEPARVAPIVDASSEPVHHIEAAVHLRQQQRASIRRAGTAVKTGDDRTTLRRLKFQQLRATLRRQRGTPSDLIKSFSPNNFLRFLARAHCPRSRNPGQSAMASR
jgi:hypothetical protein